MRRWKPGGRKDAGLRAVGMVRVGEQSKPLVIHFLLFSLLLFVFSGIPYPDYYFAASTSSATRFFSSLIHMGFLGAFVFGADTGFCTVAVRNGRRDGCSKGEVVEFEMEEDGRWMPP